MITKENIHAEYQARIEGLEARLSEAEGLIDAIKAGGVDDFALTKSAGPEIFTLQSSDFAYRIMVENINEGAINLSQEKLIVYTNKSFYELLQLPYEKVIGQPITEFIHPGSIKTFEELFAEGLQSGSKGEINLLAGETIIPVYISLTSLQPTLPTVGIIITNLTEKKQAAEELETKKTLQSIFRQSPACIAILEGPEFVFASANILYLKLVNLTEEEIIGKKLAEVFPDLIRQEILDMYVTVYNSGLPLELKEAEVEWDREQKKK